MLNKIVSIVAVVSEFHFQFIFYAKRIKMGGKYKCAAALPRRILRINYDQSPFS